MRSSAKELGHLGRDLVAGLVRVPSTSNSITVFLVSVSVLMVVEDETFGKAREKEFVKEKTVSLLFFEKGKKETGEKKSPRGRPFSGENQRDVSSTLIWNIRGGIQKVTQCVCESSEI